MRPLDSQSSTLTTTTPNGCLPALPQLVLSHPPALPLSQTPQVLLLPILGQQALLQPLRSLCVWKDRVELFAVMGAAVRTQGP